MNSVIGENYEKSVCYSQNVSAFTWDGLIGNLKSELDENFIYEVEKGEKRVRKKCLLKDLEMIRVVDQVPYYSK